METSPNRCGEALAGKYLTITLAGEAYGLAVRKVREIIQLQRITSVPQVPDYVRGVINLRSRVVPVIDLRLKFGLAAAISERTCIVIVHVRLTRDTLAMGLIVDGVEDVASLAADDIEPPPAFGADVDASYLLGLAHLRNRVVALLDLDRFIAADTVNTLVALR